MIVYSIVCKFTGRVLAKGLLLDGVDAWVERNEGVYSGIQSVGMTIFVWSELFEHKQHRLGSKRSDYTSSGLKFER